MGAGASGVHGHAVQKVVVEMSLHKIVPGIVMIQCQYLVENLVTEKVLIFKLLHAIILESVLKQPTILMPHEQVTSNSANTIFTCSLTLEISDFQSECNGNNS